MFNDFICHCRALNPKQREHRDVAAKDRQSKSSLCHAQEHLAFQVISTRSKLRIFIFNIRWPEMIPNEDLWERAGQEPVAKQILKRKWGWIGHPPEASIQHHTPNPNLGQGKRKRDRPCNSWRRDTEAELKQQGSNWTGAARTAQNRVRLRRVVDGLHSIGSDGPK